MDQENKPNAGQSEPPPAPSAEKSEPVGAATTAPATADQLTQVEEQMSAFEKSTLRWAKTAVVMSGLAAVFVCLQWWEMHTGSTDTHNLALAAANQATWTQNLATNMQTQAVRTKDLADRMKDQAGQTQRIAGEAVVQANAALAANKLNRQQFEAGNRPILGVDGDLAAREVHEGLQTRIFIENKVWNYGNSPATRVAIHFGTFTWKIGWKESEACTTADRMFNEPTSLLGVAFPHAPIQKGYWGPDMEIDGDPAHSNYIVACMTYTDLTKTIYRTRLLYTKYRDGWRLLNSEFQ